MSPRKRTIQSSEQAEPDGILKEIRWVSEEHATHALGPLGRGLRTFAQNIDLSHIDLLSIYGGHLVGTTNATFSGFALYLLRLAQYAGYERSFPEIASHIYRLIPDCFHSLILDLDKIDSPLKNQRHLRLVSDRKLRDEVRKTKKMQEIDVARYLKDGIDRWEDYPSTMDDFAKSGCRMSQEIAKLHHKKVQFYEHRLDDMAGQVHRYITEIIGHYDLHYGFRKISLKTASMILAKMTGGEVRDAHALPYIVIPSHHSLIRAVRFTPRLYPLYEWKSVAPSKIKRLVNSLEKHWMADGKAVFDHYRVLVPGTDDTDIEDDQQRIADKKAIGLFLGECDGEHYFLGEWK